MMINITLKEDQWADLKDVLEQLGIDYRPVQGNITISDLQETLREQRDSKLMQSVSKPVESSILPSENDIDLSVNISDFLPLTEHGDNFINNNKPLLESNPFVAQTNKPQKRKLMSPREVSRYFGIGEHTLFYLIRQHDFPYLKKDHYLFFDKVILQSWFSKEENIITLEHIQKTRRLNKL